MDGPFFQIFWKKASAFQIFEKIRPPRPEGAAGGGARGIFSKYLGNIPLFQKIWGKKTHPYFPKWHLLARRSKLDNPFTSLLPVSEWPQEPYEIEFLTEQWSSMTFTNQKISCSAKSVWNGPGLVQHGPEPQNINILKCLWSLLWILSIFLTDSR